MSQFDHIPHHDDREFGKSKVTSSRFLFYLSFFTFLAFVAGCSCNMIQYKYTQKAKMEVPGNTQYTPTYK